MPVISLPSQAMGPFGMPMFPGTGPGGGGGGGGGGGSGASPDMSTASYASNFDTANETTEPKDLQFNGDGTKLFVICDSTNKIFQYTISNYSIASASYDSVFKDLSGTFATNINAFIFNGDGTSFYILGNDQGGTTPDTIYQFDMSTAYDIANASYTKQGTTVGTGTTAVDNTPDKMIFNNDGTKIYISGRSTNKVHQFSLSSAYDISTISYDNVDLPIGTNTNYRSGMQWGHDGKTLYILDGEGASPLSLDLYTFTTGYDVTTGSYDSTIDVSGNGLTRPDGTNFIIIDGHKTFATAKAFEFTTSAIGGGGGGTPSATGFYSQLRNFSGYSLSPIWPQLTAIKQAPDGKYYMAGYANYNNEGGWIAQFDEDGTFSWIRKIGNGYLRLYDLIFDGNDPIVMGTDAGYGNNFPTYSPYLGYVAKFDSSGNRTWSKIFRPNNILSNSYAPGNFFTDVEKDSYGNFWCTFGYPNAQNSPVTYAEDVCGLMKFNSSGVFQGCYLLPPSGTNPRCLAQTLFIDGNDNMYLGFTTYDPTATSYPHGNISKFTINSSGVPSYAWTKSYGQNYGGAHYDVPQRMYKSSDGNLIVGGYTQQSLVSNDYYPTLMKLNDATGDFIWKKRYDKTYGESQGGTSAITSGDKIFMFGDSYNNGTLNYEYFIREIDASDGSHVAMHELDFTGQANPSVDNLSYSWSQWRNTSPKHSFQLNKDGNIICGFIPNGNGFDYRPSFAKFPSSMITGTFGGGTGTYSGNLTIAVKSVTPTDYTYAATDMTYASFSTINDVSSDYQMDNYNSGAKNDTVSTPTVVDQTGAIGSSGGGAASYFGDKALFAGSSNKNPGQIDTLDITTVGNATNFGSLGRYVYAMAAMSNGTRAVLAGGDNNTTDIVYVTFATYSTPATFGSTLATGNSGSFGGVSDGTYGVYPANSGYNGNSLEYITIATTSNGTDFGDMFNAADRRGGASDGTYGLLSGGRQSSMTTATDRFTIATPGNATDFGDNTLARMNISGMGDGTYAVFAGGLYLPQPYQWYNNIDYFTIATPGNATDFGDLVTGKSDTGATNNATRGVIAGGTGSSWQERDTIDYITIATPSNATSFGNLPTTKAYPSGTSGT